ncbi:MAG TPA: ParB/RepB/Spo0J family partition protein [Candidatus Babeliales bacterium]|nr:ParB/RepB/Spo0J family partition protein [Candidatus Babeliales bacterium]
MTTKIKEFKGSLNPIFNEGVRNNREAEEDINEREQINKDYLLIDRIKPRDDQPRKIFNESSLEELTQSIKSKGVIQPIVVRQTDNNFYEIIVGERRWRAAKRAGLEKIPAIIRDYNKSDSMAVALIENIQRENLNPLEEAEALRSLIEECAMTHNQIAESIGRSRTAVSNLLRLLDLTQEVKSMINSGLLEMGHARALLSLSYDQQIEAAKLIISKSLSVRETEKLVRNMNTPQEKPVILINPEFEKKAQTWKTIFSRQLSSKVNVHFSPEGKGKVVIHFDSVEEADWLMEHLRVE